MISLISAGIALINIKSIAIYKLYYP